MSMFGLFEWIFPLVFLAIFGMVLFVFAKSVSEWGKNNRAPRLTVEAVVVARRGHTSHQSDHHSTSYYVTFEVRSGDRMELHVPANEFGYLVEGDRGQLTFQGTRFVSFSREIRSEDCL